jgi:hypothetical protein
VNAAVDASAVADQTGTWLAALILIFIGVLILCAIAAMLLAPDPIPSVSAPAPTFGSWQWVSVDDETAKIGTGRATFTPTHVARPYVTGRHAARGAR